MPGRSSEQRFTVDQIKDALERAAGIQAGAARLLGCGRSTITLYLDRYPELRKFCDELTETTIDVAELELVKKLRAGNIAALIFYLKTKGKHRGYVERRETTGAEGGPVQTQNVDMLNGVNLDDLSEDELERVKAAFEVLHGKRSGGEREGAAG